MTGRSVPDPSNRVPPVGLLARAGFEKGDFLPLYSFNPDNNLLVSFTSTTWAASHALSHYAVVWNRLLPEKATTHVYASMPLMSIGAGETVDFRLRNTTDGETIGEITGITSTGIYTVDADYEPTTTGSMIRLRWEWKETPGTNSSDIYTPFVGLGVVL